MGQMEKGETTVLLELQSAESQQFCERFPTVIRLFSNCYSTVSASVISERILFRMVNGPARESPAAKIAKIEQTNY